MEKNKASAPRAGARRALPPQNSNNSSRWKPILFRLLSVPTLISAIAIVYFLKIPNPMMILIIPVVLFTFLDGYISGLLSGCTAMIYSAYFFFILTADKAAGEKLATIILAVSSIVFLVGKLKARDNMIMSELKKTHIELINEKEHAERLSRTKSDFLSRMSHEIRTPANAIIGMTHIAMKSRDIGRIQESLGKINDASAHLLGVINDTLDMSKIEAGKLELYISEFSLAQMLNRVVRVCQFRFDQKKQDFTMTINPGVPAAIIADQQRLAQVITNLLSNAAKFTPDDGNISLSIQLLEEGGGMATILFEVADEGIGMAEWHKAKLFQPFEQGDSSISSRFGGTGLGLVICKHIAELMGGAIWAESELGKGSVFSFTIQAGRGHKDGGDARDGGAGGGTAIADEFSGKRLLLAEDIEINREIILTLLEDTGLIIDCAENGKEALDMIAAGMEKYDIVFMDLQMPQMGGLEATRHIRALPMKRRIPIVAMTANVFKDDVDACIEAGMDDHLGKPIDIDKIMEVLRKYIQRGS